MAWFMLNFLMHTQKEHFEVCHSLGIAVFFFYELIQTSISLKTVVHLG